MSVNHIYSVLIGLGSLFLMTESQAQNKPDQNQDILARIEASGDYAPMFPFLPEHCAPQNLTNVATWQGNEPHIAGDTGFIRADGEYFKDEQGNVRRFLGTNICFKGCFPKHKDAERVADELARYGFNLVRLHYVHHAFPPEKIYPVKNSFIEPEQLELFDYLLYCLKQKGIYTYFQLNISRKFGEQNGFENADKLPHFNHGIDNYDQWMIMLQQQYIKEILNHKNPYTELRYKDEPAIAMLELANENSIIYSWFTPRYRFPDLVEPYASDLRARWNQFLTKKYGDTESLKNSWLQGLGGDGSEYISDGIISSELSKNWHLQADNGSQASWSIVPKTSKDKIKGDHFIRLDIKKIGATPNMPQFGRSGLKFKSMSPLCLRFKMRSDRPCEVTVRMSQHHAPWGTAGLNAKFSCGKKWSEYEFNFCSSMDDDGLRILFSNFTSGAVVDLADVSLVSGMNYKWDDTENLEDGTVRWPARNDWSLLPRRAHDFTEFLVGLEENYFGTMYRYTKSTVKAKQPVTGTQLRWGLDYPQAMTDFADYHSYFNHPVWPQGHGNFSLWNAGAQSLVNATPLPGSTLSALARSRILGRPFTISEYDHTNVSLYSGEGYLMGCAFGAFQDWDALIQFAWSESDNFFRSDMNPRHDNCASPQKLVHFPACWAMFVRGDVTTGTKDTLYTRVSSKEKSIDCLTVTQNPAHLISENSDLLKVLPFMKVTGVEIAEKPELFKDAGHKLIRTEDEIPESVKEVLKSKEVKSSTGEITWNWKDGNAGFFKVDTPRTKVFTGFVKGRSFEYDGLTLTPGKTRLDWLTLSLTLTNPSGEAPEGRISEGSWLLAATGLCHNTDEKIIDIGNGKYVSCAAPNGGSYGKAPVLCEGIDAALRLEGLGGKVECYALDPRGDRMKEVPVTSEGGDALVHILPDYKTIWYELKVNP